MKRSIAILAVLTATTLPAMSRAQTPPPATPPPPFTLSSAGFEDSAVIPDKFTAPTPTQFQNSPPLTWKNIPAGTVTYVLLMHDIEGALNHRTDDNTHWLMYNIPASETSLAEGIAPAPQLPNGAVQVPNARKQPGYLGPGAHGIYHHYVFDLFALDTTLSLPKDAGRVEVTEAMQGHVLGKAILVGRFIRHD